MDLEKELMDYTYYLTEQSVLGLVTILSHQDLVKKYLERRKETPHDAPAGGLSKRPGTSCVYH